MGLPDEGDRQISMRLYKYRDRAYWETGTHSWCSSEPEFDVVTEIIRASVAAGESPMWNLVRGLSLPAEFIDALSMGIGCKVRRWEQGCSAMIWFAGDTHGSFRHVVEHVLEAKRDDRLPQAIVFLGDLDCARPLHVELDEIAGLTGIFWIPGNHDSDDNTAWNNLVRSDLAHGNLHCRIGQVGSSRIAGLGGVFRKRIWSPPEDPPAFQTYEAWRSDLHCPTSAP